MKNFKLETIEKMRSLYKTIDDIDWIGGIDFTIPVSLFLKLADTEYDNDSEDVEVAQDLKIVFKDGSVLYRNEHNGVEYWDYIDLKKPHNEDDDITAITIRQVEEDELYLGANSDTLWDLNVYGEWGNKCG